MIMFYYAFTVVSWIMTLAPTLFFYSRKPEFPHLLFSTSFFAVAFCDVIFLTLASRTIFHMPTVIDAGEKIRFDEEKKRFAPITSQFDKTFLGRPN